MDDLFSLPGPLERHTLPNGLRVVMLEDRRLPLVALELCVEAGSGNEPPHLAGLAHLCEHLAFQGAAGEPSDLPALLQARGATSNASTFHGRTCFRELLPRGELDAGLWAAARRLGDRELPEDGEAVESQRRVLLAEHRQRSESRRLLADLHALLYRADHVYHRPPGGWPDGLHRLTRDDAAAFFTAHYVPERAILVLAGDVSPQQVAPRIEATLGAVPGAGAGENRRPQPLTQESPVVERRGLVRSPGTAVRCCLASRAPGYGHRLWYAADLAARAMTERSSPLQRDLIDDQGLAHAIQVSLVSMREASTVVLTVNATPGVDRRRLEAALLDSAARSLREGLSETALRRARKTAIKSHCFKMQTLAYRASLAARLTSYFDAPERLAEEPRRYRRIGTADLAALGDTLFQPNNRALLTFAAEESSC